MLIRIHVSIREATVSALVFVFIVFLRIGGHASNETQDQLPLAAPRVVLNERVLIIESEAVHGPTVGCIAWLDLLAHLTSILRPGGDK